MRTFSTTQNILQEALESFSKKNLALTKAKTQLPYYSDAIKEDTKARFNHWAINNLPFIGKYIVRLMNYFNFNLPDIFANKKLKEYRLKIIDSVKNLQADIHKKTSIIEKCLTSLEDVKVIPNVFIKNVIEGHNTYDESKKKELFFYLNNIVPEQIHQHLSKVLNDDSSTGQNANFCAQHNFAAQELTGLLEQFTQNLHTNTNNIVITKNFYTQELKEFYEKNAKIIKKPLSFKEPKSQFLSKCFDVSEANTKIFETLGKTIASISGILLDYPLNKTTSMHNNIQLFSEKINIPVDDLKLPKFLFEKKD